MISLNQQRPEAARETDGSTLDLHSIFHTIQGEGPFVGVPSIFVRLAGCNIQCPGCDTEYTQGRRMIKTTDLVNQVVDLLQIHPYTPLIVITGGEPLRQNIGPFIGELRGFTGKRIQIESNGVTGKACPDLPRQLVLDTTGTHLIISPKTSVIDPELARLAFAFKYVIKAEALDPEDGLPRVALHHRATPKVARPPSNWMYASERPIYLSPMDEKDPEANKRNLLAARDACLEHGYRLGVQLHKYAELA
jgi:7-carboxy-7-deazaguanine synthase